MSRADIPPRPLSHYYESSSLFILVSLSCRGSVMNTPCLSRDPMHRFCPLPWGDRPDNALCGPWVLIYGLPSCPLMMIRHEGHGTHPLLHCTVSLSLDRGLLVRLSMPGIPSVTNCYAMMGITRTCDLPAMHHYDIRWLFYCQSISRKMHNVLGIQFSFKAAAITDLNQ